MSYLSTCQGARTTAEPGIVLVPTIPLNRITVLGALDKEKGLSRTPPGLHNELAVGKVGIVLALLLHLCHSSISKGLQVLALVVKSNFNVFGLEFQHFHTKSPEFARLR